MKRHILAVAAILCTGLAQADPSITIYNQNFGVVRESVPLDLKQGLNQIDFTNTTAHLETDSVILRDPNSKVNFSIVEQSYRADPVTSGLLLQLNEGKEIEFIVRETQKPDRRIMGKVIRSGYLRHDRYAMQRYGNHYYQRQMQLSQSNSNQPIIEIDGKLHFSLPGEPVFPSLGDDSILKPTLNWLIHSEQAAKLDAELCYVTGGMSWEADYNLVFPQEGTDLDLTAWVTMDNQTGKDFPEAQIQLIAGDVQGLRMNRANKS